MADQKKTAEEISDDELNQIIEDMSTSEGEPSAAKPAVTLVHSATSTTPPPAVTKTGTTATGNQALSLELTGVVNLKLSFSSGDRTMELLCTEEALVCRMADGTEFRIPTQSKAKVRKVG